MDASTPPALPAATPSTVELLPQRPHCPSCNTPMERGILIDRGHFDFSSPQEWTAGTLETWLWDQQTEHDGRRLRVISMRCPSCFLLQSYAPQPPRTQDRRAGDGTSLDRRQRRDRQAAPG